MRKLVLLGCFFGSAFGVESGAAEKVDGKIQPRAGLMALIDRRSVGLASPAVFRRYAGNLQVKAFGEDVYNIYTSTFNLQERDIEDLTTAVSALARLAPENGKSVAEVLNRMRRLPTYSESRGIVDNIMMAHLIDVPGLSLSCREKQILSLWDVSHEWDRVYDERRPQGTDCTLLEHLKSQLPLEQCPNLKTKVAEYERERAALRPYVVDSNGVPWFGFPKLALFEPASNA